MPSKNNISIALFAAIILAAACISQAADSAPLVSVNKYIKVNNIKQPNSLMVELGKKLFFDRRLSGDGTMSCATCHNPEIGFTDGLPISLSYPTTRNWRNSPTLINVAFKTTLFHDGRADSLEQQALFPLMSAFEMNQNLDYMEEELRAVPAYVQEFKRAFGSETITRLVVAEAIAAFQRTLISRGSPLDLFLDGDSAVLSAKTHLGMELFTGKAGCIRCHRGVNLSDGQFHRTGAPDNPAMKDDPRTIATIRFVAKVAGYDKYSSLTEDPGRYLVTGLKSDWKAFATPTLRDISRSAPYMHNGALETIEDVINFYDKGGGEANTAGLVPLGLTAQEKIALEAFLVDALTGKSIIIDYPRIPL